MRQLSPPRGTPNRRRGFTLIELLVVIGIIVVLVTILVPVLSKVRRAAYAHQTREEINRLEDAIMRYYDDFKAYPGPFSNDDIVDNQADWQVFYSGGQTVTLHPEHGSSWGNGLRGDATLYPWPKELSSSGSASAGKSLAWVTSTENLVLGLLGGLVWQGPSNLASYSAASFDSTYVAYDPDSAYLGKGPMNLNPANPRRFPAYMEARPEELTRRNNNYSPALPGQWIDPYFASGFASKQYVVHNSVIPEILDRFGDDAMPILYLRARVGAPGIACMFSIDMNAVYGGGNNNGNNNTLGMLQYDMGQVWDYLASPCLDQVGHPGPGANYPDPYRLGQSGIPNKLTYYTAANNASVSFYVHHGLMYAGIPYTNMVANGVFNRDPDSPELPGLNFYIPFLMDVTGTTPTWWSGVQAVSSISPGSSANYLGTPKNKDRYILISAGIDRIFGTMDDIANFQLNQPSN